MSDRLFPIEEVPEVSLLREPPRRRGEGDARFRNDYPPQWSRCERCDGAGALVGESDLQVNVVRNADVQGTATMVKIVHLPSGMSGIAVRERRGVRLGSMAMREEAMRQLLTLLRVVVAYQCQECLGMGSTKAMVRYLARHRCERCLHPYVPKGDAAMLGVEPSWADGCGGWTVCDGECRHAGPLRVVEEGRVYECPPHQDLEGLRLGGLSPAARVEAAWRILTVHHLDGDKANLAWWNLAALCQRCHLAIQANVVLDRVYVHEHTEWFRPHAAGYYAKVYLGEDVSRLEALEREDELLALERAV